jgi:hypothetical protein
MPTDVDQLRAIKTQTLARIAEITAAPKPSYSIDGQDVSWSEYLEQLARVVDWCERKLAGAEPFEIHSQGTT